MKLSRKSTLIIGLNLASVVCFLLAAIISTPRVYTQQDTEATDSAEESEVAPASNAYCLLCHENTDLVWRLPSGETLSLQIDPDVLATSVHGASNPEGELQCADCHENFRFPHTPSTSQTLREFRIERYATCRNCHEDQYTHAQDSVHGAALRNGQFDAATCVDCHGGHDIQTPNEPRERISLTCGSCHGAIFEEYATSIHGTDLISEHNPDVPTCIDCHGVHDIENPTTALFRQRSPDLCAECHADKTLMQQYDISTHVFDSYLTDFHGTTVALFEQEAPDVVTNKAVCYDCHGVHNIQAVSDSEDGIASIRTSLVETCRECHPDASDDFSSAWLGHFPVTFDLNPGLFVANGFYTLATPLLIGFATVMAGTELLRRLFRRRSKPGGEEGK